MRRRAAALASLTRAAASAPSAPSARALNRSHCDGVATVAPQVRCELRCARMLSFSASSASASAQPKAHPHSGTTHRTPSGLYRDMVAAGEIRHDPHQETVLRHLDSIHAAVSDTKFSADLKAIERDLGGDGDAETSGTGPRHSFTSSLSSLLGKAWGSAASSSTTITDADQVQHREFFGSGPRGLYLYGGVGCGKTFLMDTFYDALPQRLHAHRKRVHFNTFMLNCHSRIYKFRNTKGKNRVDPIPSLAAKLADEAWILCFDEFQVTDVADAAILHRLFTRLHELGVVVIATSNRKPSDLYKGGLQRELFVPFIHFVEREYEVHQLKSGNDYRLIGTAGEDWRVWYSPAPGDTQIQSVEQATAEVDRVFEALTGDSEAKSTVITVSGHALCVPAQARGVAKFTFVQVCEQALGAADYAALAQSFHTVIITGVPLLTMENRDAARRFILLVDELYQHQARVVISATAPPNSLFNFFTEGSNVDMTEATKRPGFVRVGEDEHFAKDRAISRLIEMQSEEYLRAAQESGAHRDADWSA